MRFKLKSGSPAQVAAYTGPAGEIVISDTSKVPYIQDGVSAGGHPVDGIHHTVVKPTPIAPADGSVGVSVNPTLQGDIFSGSGQHIATRWQVADDSEFNNIIFDSGLDSVNLTQFSMAEVETSLSPLSTYYYRMFYVSDTAGDSAWSQPASFATTDYIEYAKIGDVAATGSVGSAVGGCAISDDGNTAVLSYKSQDNLGVNSAGMVLVMTRIGDIWTEQQRLFFHGTPIENDYFGLTVAISADGSKIVLGSPYADNGDNSAFSLNRGRFDIYELEQGTWVRRTSSTGTRLESMAGYSVSISNDSDTVVVGQAGTVTSDAGKEDAGGIIVVYKDSQGTTATLRHNPASLSADERFGIQTAVSANGSTIAVGGNGNSGAYIYDRVDGVLTEEVKLSDLTPLTNDHRCVGIDISANGDIVAVSLRTASAQSVIYVLSRANGIWALANTLTKSLHGFNLCTVKVSDDGTRILLVEPTVSGSTGGMCVLDYVSGAWTVRQTVRPGDFAGMIATSGNVGFSGDGRYVLLGGNTACQLFEAM